MQSQDSNNGNTQLNSERAKVNQRVSRYAMLGKSRKVYWDGARRNRTI
jgi:hypothetical protein